MAHHKEMTAFSKEFDAHSHFILDGVYSRNITSEARKSQAGCLKIQIIFDLKRQPDSANRLIALKINLKIAFSGIRRMGCRH